MPFNITVDHVDTAHNSDQSSVSSSDEEDSTGTGVQVSPRLAADNNDYSDLEETEEREEDWVLPDEIGPSDSASRPRTSNQPRPIVEAPQPEHARRPGYRRHITNERVRPPPRTHRSPPSEQAESVDSHDEWPGGYARGPPPQHYQNRQYAQYPQPGYPAPHPYQPYPPQSVVPAGQQQMVPYGYSPYAPAIPTPTNPYFAPGHHPGLGHEMVPHAPGPGYFPYAPQGFPMPMSPPAVYQVYPTPPPAPAQPSTPAPAAAKTPPPQAAPPDTSKEEAKLAILEKLIEDQKAKDAAREAALEKAAKDAAAKAEADKKKAEEIAAASAAAAAAAREEVDNKYKAAAKAAAEQAEADKKKADEIAAASAAAAKSAREEVEKEHKDAAEAAAKDAEAAAAAAPPPPAPAAPEKPIKFKDAIGRRFSFPFELCKEWRGMEYLIKEAFLHVTDYGPHVANGEYDLIGPQGEIIMTHIWNIVIQPGWEITMHMWPIPEPGPEELVNPMADIVMVDEGAPPPPPPVPLAPGGKRVLGKKDKKRKEKVPPLFSWAAGTSRKKAVKAKSKK